MVSTLNSNWAISYLELLQSGQTYLSRLNKRSPVVNKQWQGQLQGNLWNDELMLYHNWLEFESEWASTEQITEASFLKDCQGWRGQTLGFSLISLSSSASDHYAPLSTLWEKKSVLAFLSKKGPCKPLGHLRGSCNDSSGSNPLVYSGPAWN